MSLYRTTRGLLRSHGIRPRKSLGQHFLVDESVLARIIEAAQLEPQETVVEIGGGVGALTQALARHAGHVHCLEIDPKLVEVLRDALSRYENVTIHEADALKFDYWQIASPYSVVANIPYQITAPLVERLIAERARLRRITLTVQREVARRLHAPPGSKDYGSLSVTVAFYFEAKLHGTVPAEAFWPRPEVDSTIISLSPRPKPALDVDSQEAFLGFVRLAFAQRRKTLRNNLKALKAQGFSADQIEEALRASGIEGSRRAETLSLEEFGKLWRALSLV